MVTVNTEVQADIKIAMQLNKFITDSFFFSGDDVLFNYQLQNIGNQELKPKGDIRIYDRTGHEVISIPVNADGKSITPDQQAQLASAWSAAKGFGKFKAFLNVDYGNGTLQDTVYFWIIPWQQLLVIFVISLIGIIVGALYFHRWLEHRHMQKFALAGMGAGAAVLAAPAGMLVPPKPLPPVRATNVMPVIPKPERKGFFARFRRTKKIATAPEAVISPAIQVPIAASTTAVVAPMIIAAEQPVTISVPEPLKAAPVIETRASGTIDLSKGPIQQTPVRHHDAHIINLKNGS